MPQNAIYVGRPSRWGNPFLLGFNDREDSIKAYEGWLRIQIARCPHFLEPLKGKDLACWCPLEKPCHADVLLEVLKGMEAT